MFVANGTPQQYYRKFQELKNMPKAEKNTEPEYENNGNSTLVGFARKSNAGRAVKLSINTTSFQDCQTYVTSDGQTYVQLVVSLNALASVIDGSRAVTSINHLND
tara:strand:+ start:656 stop:970 length:315 start_codon:yes stop_codon:yes gene_type:complete